MITGLVFMSHVNAIGIDNIVGGIVTKKKKNEIIFIFFIFVTPFQKHTIYLGTYNIQQAYSFCRIKFTDQV